MLPALCLLGLFYRSSSSQKTTSVKLKVGANVESFLRYHVTNVLLYKDAFFKQKSGRAEESEQKVIQSSPRLHLKLSKCAGWFPTHHSLTRHAFWQSVLCLGSAIWFLRNCYSIQKLKRNQGFKVPYVWAKSSMVTSCIPKEPVWKLGGQLCRVREKALCPPPLPPH
jgi:hypothetical protein